MLAGAGAHPWDRDAVDRRLVDEARRGTGRIIDCESEAGTPSRPPGYPP